MRSKDLTDLLNSVKSGSVSIEDATSIIRQLPFEDLGYAKIDHHREIRTGFPEVIYSEGKTSEQILGIMAKIMQRKQNILATRVSKKISHTLKKSYPDLEYYEKARIVYLENDPVQKGESLIAIVTGGTSDIPVAEEAAITAEKMGNPVDRIYDVGVAGLHRLLSFREKLLEAKVIIAVAGMEGALASVIGGLLDKPVIAVPTSVGYGASFGGIAALLTMLNSCASGVGVVNIDNGFGAGYLAALITRQINQTAIKKGKT